MRFKTLRKIAKFNHAIQKFWYHSSGEWRWLDAKRLSITSLNRLLWQESVPSLAFFTMLVLSGIIATAGLLSGSTATVIGAMIIAPLMGPIIGISYAFSVGNRRLIRRSFLTIVLGTIATILSAILICKLTGLQTLTPEIFARTEPTLLDLLVAIAAGAAGAYAKLTPRISNAFPGVAISVALVPPLSIVGIGLALGNTSVWLGAGTLWIANLTGIILSGVLIFLWQGYGSFKRAKGGLILSLGVVLLVCIPLGISFERLLSKSKDRQIVRYAVETQLAMASYDVRSIQLSERDRVLLVEVEVSVKDDQQMTADNVQSIQSELQELLDQPVFLRVTVFDIQEFSAPIGVKP
jgi:uncharacterized hydrophobic protein (TIGR00271 family)